jgi:hypothetical protein
MQKEKLFFPMFSQAIIINQHTTGVHFLQLLQFTLINVSATNTGVTL